MLIACKDCMNRHCDLQPLLQAATCLRASSQVFKVLAITAVGWGARLTVASCKCSVPCLYHGIHPASDLLLYPSFGITPPDNSILKLAATRQTRQARRRARQGRPQPALSLHASKPSLCGPRGQTGAFGMNKTDCPLVLLGLLSFILTVGMWWPDAFQWLHKAAFIFRWARHETRFMSTICAHEHAHTLRSGVEHT